MKSIDYDALYEIKKIIDYENNDNNDDCISLYSVGNLLFERRKKNKNRNKGIKRANDTCDTRFYIKKFS